MTPPGDGAVVVTAGLVGASVWLVGSGRVAASAGRAAGPRIFVGVVLGALVLAGSGLRRTMPSPGHGIALAAVAALVAAAVLARARRRRTSRRARERSGQVLLTCESLRADLEAGQPPVRALARAAQSWPELAPVARAAELDDDVPVALRALAARRGAEQLRLVAAAWEVAQRSGGGLASALRQSARLLRAERATRRVVEAEIAAARATGRMMALLPVGVLVFGASLGGDPAGFLLGSWAGLACLGTGGALMVAGVRWIDAIADGVAG